MIIFKDKKLVKGFRRKEQERAQVYRVENDIFVVRWDNKLYLGKLDCYKSDDGLTLINFEPSEQHKLSYIASECIYTDNVIDIYKVDDYFYVGACMYYNKLYKIVNLKRIDNKLTLIIPFIDEHVYTHKDYMLFNARFFGFYSYVVNLKNGKVIRFVINVGKNIFIEAVDSKELDLLETICKVAYKNPDLNWCDKISKDKITLEQLGKKLGTKKLITKVLASFED